MTTKPTTKPVKQKSAAARAVPTPGEAIADAVKKLERDISQSIRTELKNLGKMIERIERDVQKRMKEAERAIDRARAGAKKPPAAKKAPAKKAPAKKAAAKKAPAKKAPAKKAPAKK